MSGAGHGHGGDHGGAENKRIALLIAVLALVLAFAETLGKSAQTAAIDKNIEASNLWSFFQAKTIRMTVLRTAAEAAELELDQVSLATAKDGFITYGSSATPSPTAPFPAPHTIGTDQGGGARFQLGDDPALHVQSQTSFALLFIRSVTGKTFVRQDRANVAVEVDPWLRRGAKAGKQHSHA